MTSHLERDRSTALTTSSATASDDAAEAIADNGAVYPILAKHQREEFWQGREMMALLQQWAERFINEFKLDIPEVVLCLDRLPANRYGHFRYGHNGFGLRGEVAINSRYLIAARPAWQILGTLLHELLHAWQQAHGRPGAGNHHNAEFRRKAAELGLVIDARGITGYAATSRFKDLLGAYGLSTPDHEIRPVDGRQRGSSKLAKWSCGCTNIRVAKAGFRAICLNCGQEFAPH